jgi:hypothetical protein
VTPAEAGRQTTTAKQPDPEAAYYQTVEEFFVSRRGDPLFLSNSDWLQVRKWRVAGLPLRVVLRGIADALDSHAHSWSRDRKVGSLAYCAAEVAAAAERWQRALSLDGEEGVGAASCLERFAEALEGASGLTGDAEEAAFHLAAELRTRAASGEEGASGLEPWLKEREAELLVILRRQMAPGTLAALERNIESDLAPYIARMPLRVVTQVRADAQARRVLEASGLPRLSLFHL